MSYSIEDIKRDYPLHWLIWNNDDSVLRSVLDEKKCDLEQLDPHGRTPLMLAVRLSHLQSVQVLLSAKCNANAECEGWSVVQEAVASGDPDILTAILEVRDLQRHLQRVTHVPQLLQKLIDAPDFYVEMKWEFTSWVPLMSRLCPSDVYKVYKRGSNVRIDTTLLGFDQNTWQRGDRSYIFKGQQDAAVMIEVDHETQEVSVEQLRGIEGDISGIVPTRESVRARLAAPVTTNGVDMEKISFERNKTGIWGWGSEKTETINGYDCKVYAATNVEFVTKTRTEHLNESQARIKNSRTPLHSILGMGDADDEATTPVDDDGDGTNQLGAASPLLAVDTTVPVTPEEYFSGKNLNGRDVGRPKRLNTKVQKFKANLWLSETFPIKLQEQVLPILDLMSTMASPHVSKLKDFITMQLPSGFPVKIEIPLFHVLNACVTFGNVFALDVPVKNVTNIRETDDRLTCIVDDGCFDIPTHYVNKNGDVRRHETFEDEDDLVQYAIQQSLMDAGSESDQVDIWEALRVQRPITPNNLGAFGDEDAQLQRALQESLQGYYAQATLNGTVPTGTGVRSTTPTLNSSVNQQHIDTDLAMALRLSEQEQMSRQQQLREEEEMLERALRLSLDEK